MVAAYAELVPVSRFSPVMAKVSCTSGCSRNLRRNASATASVRCIEEPSGKVTRPMT